MYLKIHIYVSFSSLYIYHYIAIKELMNERMKKKPNLCISSGRSKSKIKKQRTISSHFISVDQKKTRTFVERERETKAKKHNFYLSYLFRVSLKLINKIIERKKKRSLEFQFQQQTPTITQNASQSGLNFIQKRLFVIYFYSLYHLLKLTNN